MEAARAWMATAGSTGPTARAHPKALGRWAVGRPYTRRAVTKPRAAAAACGLPRSGWSSRRAADGTPRAGTAGHGNRVAALKAAAHTNAGLTRMRSPTSMRRQHRRELRSMPQHPSVSIGLPVYNGERYLALCIESVLNQTYADFELIISDNGSTDSTRQICEDFARRDPRIR